MWELSASSIPSSMQSSTSETSEKIVEERVTRPREGCNKDRRPALRGRALPPGDKDPERTALPLLLLLALLVSLSLASLASLAS
jgi:hypothetical protein